MITPSAKMFNRTATVYMIDRTGSESEGEWTEELKPKFSNAPCNVQKISVSRQLVNGMDAFPFSHFIYFPWNIALEHGYTLSLNEDMVIGVDVDGSGRQEMYDVVSGVERQSDPGRFIKISLRIRGVEAHV